MQPCIADPDCSALALSIQNQVEKTPKFRKLKVGLYSSSLLHHIQLSSHLHHTYHTALGWKQHVFWGILGNVGNLVEKEHKSWHKTLIKHYKIKHDVFLKVDFLFNVQLYINKAVIRFIKLLLWWWSWLQSEAILDPFPNTSCGLKKNKHIHQELIDLKGRWTQTLSLSKKKNKTNKKIRHVCSSSGNRQLYLSQLSYKLGKIVTFTIYGYSFLFLENSILYAWKYKIIIIIMSFRWCFFFCPRHQSTWITF